MLRRIVAFALVSSLALVIPLAAQASLPGLRLVSLDPAPRPFAADCPGGLRVGTGMRDIVPGDPLPDGGWRLWQEPYVDMNANGVYDAADPLEPGSEGDPFTDENGNGKWDGPFMAGYGHEKGGNEYYVAQGVHDLVWARAIALTCGDRTLGLVSVDTVGLFRGFVLDVRAAAPAEYDHVVVASTHTHGSFDTMGLWGAHLLSDGKDPRAMARIHDRILDALRDALADREPVTSVQVASARTRDAIPTTGTLQTDIRDPFVIDDKVVAARLLAPSGATVATLVNWAPHPETLAGTNGNLSGDYAHYLREAIETRDGGTAVFFSGAVGGMMTTLGARPKYPDGSFVPDHSFEKARVIGEAAAELVATALDSAPVLAVDGVDLAARAFNVPLDNPFLAALNSLGVLDHETAVGPFLVHSTGEPGVVVPAPFLRVEVNVVALEGPDGKLLQMLTLPGEMLPEVPYGNPLRHDLQVTPETCFAFNPDKLLFNGGRNGKLNPATGSAEPGFERVQASRPEWPKEPAFATMATARETMLLGLANDELGYMVSADDFQLPTLAPEVWSDGVDRCGDTDHYEETNSASSLMALAVANHLAQMLDPAFVPDPVPPLAAEVDWDARGEPTPPCVRLEPNARAAWVDLDGDCRFGARDALLRADLWTRGEGEPRWRPEVR